MTESALGAPASPEEPLTVERLAEALQEPDRSLLDRVLAHLGPERCAAVLADTLTCEANGGLLTNDGSRRRTPGGVFIQLVGRQLGKRQRRQLFPYKPPPKGSPRARSTDKTPAVPTWEEIATATRTLTTDAQGDASVKVTLIGRPARTEIRGQAVVFRLQSQPPATLPKGLPPLPQGPPVTWTVVVAQRQWNRVREALETDPQDRLLIEGYPLQQGKELVVLAQSCISLAQQRARKAQQQSQQAQGEATP